MSLIFPDKKVLWGLVVVQKNSSSAYEMRLNLRLEIYIEQFSRIKEAMNG